MKRLFQALASLGDGAFVLDRDQQIIYWNLAAEDIVGYKYKEVVGQPCYEILAGQDDQRRLICHTHCRVAATAFEGGTAKSYDACVRTKSGDIRWINMSTFTFPTNNNGTGSVLVHLFRDVTQKKKNEEFVDQVLQATKNLQVGALPQIVPPDPAANGHITALTSRELEVLALLAKGFSTSDIARSLAISSSTVRNHIRNILQKLQVRSRLEAVIYAFNHDLVPRE